MVSGNWFKEYKIQNDDIKEIYLEYILDDEQKMLVQTYNKFKDAVRIVSADPKELLKEMPNIPEEVAMIFNDECVSFAKDLLTSNCIDDKIYNLIRRLDKLFKSLNNDRTINVWTIESMYSDIRWIKTRVIAQSLYILL